MKYVLAAVTVFVLIAGCSVKKKSAATSGEQRIKLTATFYPVYIELLNIAGGIPGVEVRNLTSPTSGCLHDYQLTSRDMKILEATDILAANGAGMENFIEKASLLKKGIKILKAAEGLPLITDKESGSTNPHVWVSVSGAILQTSNLTELLSAADPVHRLEYISNSKKYIEKLSLLRDEMHLKLNGLRSSKIITFHEAFPYFAEEFGLNIVSVIEREPGSEPSAAEIASTIRIIKKFEIKAFFAEPQYPATSADAIARETGAKVYNLDPVVTGPDDKDAYLEIMRSNLSVLQSALGKN